MYRKSRFSIHDVFIMHIECLITKKCRFLGYETLIITKKSHFFGYEIFISALKQIFVAHILQKNYKYKIRWIAEAERPCVEQD